MRPHPGAGAIISWEPDGSPQVMTVMTSSLEPSKTMTEIKINQAPLDHCNVPATGTV
jgi:hypothetical protein